jgi:hypothetical protein
MNEVKNKASILSVFSQLIGHARDINLSLSLPQGHSLQLPTKPVCPQIFAGLFFDLLDRNQGVTIVLNKLMAVNAIGKEN